MGDPPSRRPSRHRLRVTLLSLCAVLSLAIAAGSGFAIATIRHVESNIVHIKVGSACTDPDCLVHVDPECTDKVCNFLVLGSDSRKGVPKSLGSTKSSPGQRSDTILVVTVDPKVDRTVVLSIPRDLRVQIPGHGVGKINTAFSYGHGADLIVQTVEKLTGMSINHYVEVNFLGFQGLVNALGGVPVCINRPLHDSLAGLNLPSAGCYNLKGSTALAFVRARHVEGDNIPDFSRISRQQQFMRALISKALSVGSIVKLPDLIRAVQDNLKLDANLNLYELQDLTRKLAKVGQRGVTFRIVPAVPIQIGAVDYLQLEQPQASDLFERIRDGKRLRDLGLTSTLTAISSANVTVQVFDADSGGAASQVVDFLQKAGFNVLPLQTAPPDLTHSAILWRPASSEEKEVVRSYLTLLPSERNSTYATGSTVVVVVASDFPGLEGVSGG